MRPSQGKGGGGNAVPHLSSLSFRISRGSHVAFGILLF